MFPPGPIPASLYFMHQCEVRKVIASGCVSHVDAQSIRLSDGGSLWCIPLTPNACKLRQRMR